MSVSRFAAVAVLLAGSLARAQSAAPAPPADLGPPATGIVGAPGDGGAPPDRAGERPRHDPYERVGAASQGPHAGSPIAAALDDFDFGDYEAVVQRLRPLAESGARDLSNKADRTEALRVYGIACTLTGRQAAAEGSFLLLLREEPSMRLDPTLVRPEAVSFFEEVRARHREELLSAYRRGKPRYYPVFNVLPLVGQIQNRQWKKLIGIGAAEVGLLASTITTAVLLEQWQGADHTFRGHTSAYAPLRDVNIISFSLLLGVTTYGIIDGFVVGARRQKAERKAEATLGF